MNAPRILRTLQIAALGMSLIFSAIPAARGQIIVADNYDVTGIGTGFNLNTGVNSGINPPTTRLTGSAAANLRYLQTATTKAATAYSITGGKLTVAASANPGRFVFSADGNSPFDFQTALSSGTASVSEPSIYEISITMANTSAGIQRASFALCTEDNNANFWDFAVQLWRANSADNFYTIQKRIDTGSSGLGGDLNAPIATTAPGTYGTEVTFLIRVTDTGAETTTFNSRVQVSIDDGQSWIYDTQTDPDLPNGWRLNGAGRFIIWDQAGQTAATYDNFSLFLESAPPPPPTRVWTGGGTDDNWSTGANWGGTAPSSGEPLVFGLAARQANFNDLALTTPTLTFTNGGFFLSGNQLSIGSAVINETGSNNVNLALDWPFPGGKSWQIAAGSELNLSGFSAIAIGGDHVLSGGGTLRISGGLDINQNPAFILQEGRLAVDGGTFSSLGGFRIGSLAGAGVVETLVANNGSLLLEVPAANLRVGDAANVTARLIVNNGNVSMLGGMLGIPYAANATGEVHQNGGLVKDAYIVFSDNGAGDGVYAVTNGAVEPFQIRRDIAGGTAVMRFQNAVLRPALGTTGTDFMSGLDVAEILPGGLTIDATSDVTISQALSGPGGLTKINFFSVNLTGTNTYAGNTLVQEGKLSLPTTQTNSAAIQVAGGAELGVRRSLRGTTLTAGSLVHGGGVISFDLGEYGNPAVPLMQVNTLTVSGGAGSVTIHVTGGLGLTPGQFPLIDYSGAISGGFASFTLGNLPPDVSATLVDNVANSSIDLNITAAPGFRWTGASNSDWDFGTVNWINEALGAAAAYQDGFVTTFRDGATRSDVNLTTFFAPAAIIVSNTNQPYTLNGGGLTTALIRKTGPGSLTRTEGAQDAVTEIELNQGAYIFSISSDATFNTLLTDASDGAGTFEKRGNGVLTVDSANTTFDGTIVVSGGTLKAGNGNSLGTTNGTTVITNGGTLDVNNINFIGEPVIVSGAGAGGVGAIIDSTTGTGVQVALTDVTMTGDTTFGAPNGGRWDIRVRANTGPGPGLRGNGFDLTKVGPGFVSIACQRSLGANTPYWQMDLGDVLISEGTLAFAESLSLGSPAFSITLNAGASLQFFDMGFTNPVTRNINLTDASLNLHGGSDGTNVITGNVQITGANVIEVNQATSFIEGVISGSGALTVQMSGSPQTGTLILNGANTFAGDLTLASGTLGGNGSLTGNLIVNGGTLSPGTSLGTFSVAGNVSLGGTTRMEIDPAQSPNSDRVVAGGALTFGGALVVQLPAGAASPEAGDEFQLFNKGGAGGFSSITLPDLTILPGNLSWNTNELATLGKISVVGDGTTGPVIEPPFISNGNLILTGNNGPANGTYSIVTSTNVAAPLTEWTTNLTGNFAADGTFSNAVPVNASEAKRFFLIKQP